MRDLELRADAPDSRLNAFAYMPVCGMRYIPSQADVPLPEGAIGFGIIGTKAGTLSAHIGQTEMTIESGMAAVIPVNIPYRIKAKNDCEVLYALVCGSVAECLLSDAVANGILFPNGGNILSMQLHPLLQSQQSGESCDSTIAGIAAFSLLAQLSRYGRQRSEEQSRSAMLMQTALHIMQEEFATIYGIQDIADRLELSEGHFIRLFSQTMGVTPGQYLTKLKIEFSKKLLADPSLSVGMVAELSGFSNGSYFGKVFRRATGMSPSEYAHLIAGQDDAPAADTSALYL